MPDSASPSAPLRARLLEAARAELDAVGAERLTVRGVARRADVSHAAPGYEFGGRAGLLTALAAIGFGELRAALASVPDDPRASPADRLIAMGRAYVAYAEAQPGLFAVMFDEPSVNRTDPEYRAAAGPALSVLAEKLASNLLVDPSVAWAVAHGVATLIRSGALDGTGVDPAERAELILTQFGALAGRAPSAGH